jgi:hypothetical protein
MDITEVIVSIVLLLLTGLSVMLWWFTTYTIKSLYKENEQLRIDAGAIKDTMYEKVNNLKSELDLWKIDSAREYNSANRELTRLDTLIEERLADVIEIKEMVNSITQKYVCKQDLKDAIKELKELVNPRY